MLNKVSNFYNSHKYVILWTVGYTVATWAIMNFMFNFNIFSKLRWWQLMHAHLHGFASMVFGILVLAAVPMYIATTIVIVRTKAPLFKITIPEFIKKAFTQTPSEEPVDEVPTSAEKTEEKTEPENNAPAPVPETVPNEMRFAYVHAREHLSRTPTSVFDLGNVTKTVSVPVPEQSEVIEDSHEMPIPTDFTIDDIDDITDSVPQFTDINFDDDDDTPIEIEDDIKEQSDTIMPVTEYMKSQSVPYTIDDDVVVTDKFAIVAHTDNDFWVADKDAWFAAGKTRKSPIELVQRVATEHNVEPVLFLGSNNIMDIDALIPQWESAGIRVISDLKDLM